MKRRSSSPGREMLLMDEYPNLSPSGALESQRHTFVQILGSEILQSGL